MRVKKVNIFKDITLENYNFQLKLFFLICKNFIFISCPNMARFLKNCFIFEDLTLKKKCWKYEDFEVVQTKK